jgi:hypothetical protein
MASSWIVLSTRWGLTSVQASLNVIISVLSTVGLWAFTRYWWRRGGIQVLRNKNGVPLSRLFTISSPGEAWDVIATLGRQIFAKENWHLLTQLIVVAGITIACALAGPIAKVSLRNGTTIRLRELQILQSVKGAGPFGNLLYSTLIWNDTAQSLNDANFPTNQLLDILPPLQTPPWTYIPEEWDPTWTVTCDYVNNFTLLNLTGSGKGNYFDPLTAFPVFRDTYNQTWLDSAEYRMTADYNSWQDWTQENQTREALFYVIVQSDPEVGDRMMYNNETLRLSLSVLHARDFRVLVDDTSGIRGMSTWFPIGPVGSASYSRAECELTRKPLVQDENRIPWPWTNDTLSIMNGYAHFFHDPFAAAAVKGRGVVPPSAEEMFRFYQVYMASINTFHSDPTPQQLSVVLDTVELSAIFLAMLLLLALLSGWSSLQYAWFLRRNKLQLKDLYVPDGKMEWMIHAVKCSENGYDLERGKDSDHFCTATFGLPSADLSIVDQTVGMPRLARVRSGRSSISGSDVEPVRKYSVSPARSHKSNLSSLSEDDSKNNKTRTKSGEANTSTCAKSPPFSPVPTQSAPSEHLCSLSRVPTIDIHDADEEVDAIMGLGLSPMSTRSSAASSIKAPSLPSSQHSSNHQKLGNECKPTISPTSINYSATKCPKDGLLTPPKSPVVLSSASAHRWERGQYDPTTFIFPLC